MHGPLDERAIVARGGGKDQAGDPVGEAEQAEHLGEGRIEIDAEVVLDADSDIEA